MNPRPFKNFVAKTFSDLIRKIEMLSVKNESTGCIEFQGWKDRDGYGHLSFKNKKYKVHRAVLMNTTGNCLEGLLACHSCDNPSCVNPEHLFIGTPKDNHKDMWNKNRQYTPFKLKTHCKRGHPYDRHNGYSNTCSVCLKMHSSNYRKNNLDRIKEQDRLNAEKKRRLLGIKPRNLKRNMEKQCQIL